MLNRTTLCAVAITAFFVTGCSGSPGPETVVESFYEHAAKNDPAAMMKLMDPAGEALIAVGEGKARTILNQGAKEISTQKLAIETISCVTEDKVSECTATIKGYASGKSRKETYLLNKTKDGWLISMFQA